MIRPTINFCVQKFSSSLSSFCFAERCEATTQSRNDWGRKFSGWVAWLFEVWTSQLLELNSIEHLLQKEHFKKPYRGNEILHKLNKCLRFFRFSLFLPKIFYSWLFRLGKGFPQLAVSKWNFPSIFSLRAVPLMMTSMTIERTRFIYTFSSAFKLCFFVHAFEQLLLLSSDG